MLDVRPQVEGADGELYSVHSHPDIAASAKQAALIQLSPTKLAEFAGLREERAQRLLEVIAKMDGVTSQPS